MRARTIRTSIRFLGTAVLGLSLLAPVAFAQDEAERRPAQPRVPDDVAAIRPRVPEAPDPEPPTIGEDPTTFNEGGEGHSEGHGHEDPTKTYNFFSLHYGKDQYGGKFGDGVQGPAGHETPGEEPMSGPFAFMLINFGLLLVLIGKYGGPAARKMAETRSDQIKKALDEAAKLRQAAADKLAEYSTKLSAAQAEMATMLTNMRADAQTEKARILAAAEAQAAAVQRDADLRIAAEIDRARTELAREVAIAAANVAEKLLREKATATDQSAMVDTFIKDVESAARSKTTSHGGVA